MRQITPELLDDTVLETSYKLGKSIAAVRKSQKLSQIELAFDAGVGRSTLIEIERGSPKVQLAHYLSVMKELGMLHLLSQSLDAFSIGQIADSMKRAPSI